MPDASANAAPASDDLLTESLRLLVAAHYLLAGVTLLLAPVGIYLVLTGWSLLHPARGDAWVPRPGQEILDPLRWGAVFFMAGGALTGLAVLHAGLIAYVGRSIARRRRRLFCLIFTIFDLTYIPLGTALGIFALVLLLKPQIKQQFR